MMKKLLSTVLAMCMLAAILPTVSFAEERNVILLDGEWNFKFYSDEALVPNETEKVDFEDKIIVPGAMELQGYGTPSYYYEEMTGWGMAEDDGVRSVGLYMTQFDLKKDWNGELVFDAFRDELTVYVDYEKMGESKNGAAGDCFKTELKKGKHTLICVVKRNNSGINKNDDFALSGLTGSVYLTEGTEEQADARSVKIENGKLMLDGKECVLKGVYYTPTAPEGGNTMTNERIEEDVKLIKEYGFNAVWTSCAPDYFYERAEKEGLYVIDEVNVNLEYADREGDSVEKRIQQIVKRHKKYNCIIMWSVGRGDASRVERFIKELKSLDNRPVAQEAVFAEDFEVFGNTGGMEDWLKTLGEGNVGGFMDEFADKELYYTKRKYDFCVTDLITKEKLTLEGEISNYNGVDMLAKGEYERKTDERDAFTVLSYISNADSDRVIFESLDGKIKLETKNYMIRLTADGNTIDADGGEGKVAIVYADGEVGLFTSRSFKGNAECDAVLKDGYKVGAGNGKTLIEYVKIYDKALTIDELVEMTAEDSCVSSVRFDDVEIIKDKSYEFLAYGGDFGDNPNSYYKCLTGIFTSTREPHPEAKAFKALLKGEYEEKSSLTNSVTESKKAEPTALTDKAVFKAAGTEITVDFDGSIKSIKKNGEEMLSDAMVPILHRDNTLREYELGVENREAWKAGKTEIVDNTLFVELISTVTDGKIYLAYTMYESGAMTVSMQARFADGATSPTFVGFSGAGNFDTAEWIGSGESSYPDRPMAGKTESFQKSIGEMGDNYSVPQENGNRSASSVTLSDKNGQTLNFSAVNGQRPLQFRVLDYSSDVMYEAEHDEEIQHEDKAYFRIGGHIAGLGDNSEYKLTENEYGFDFVIDTADGKMPKQDVTAVYIDGEVYEAFASGVKDYVYRTNKKVNVTADGENVIQDDKKAVIGDYTVYFAPNEEYLSDMEVKENTAEIALDTDFNKNKINMRANSYWEPSVSYDKGVTVRNGSVVYDVSHMNNHVFTAVVGKNDFDWRSYGGFDRNMFEASCDVEIILDGRVAEKISDVSMRSASREISIDVSDAETMEIRVTGSGRAPRFEDAVFADASFVPKGPVIVNFEKKDGKARITVLNTDEDCVDVILTVTEGTEVSACGCKIKKGLYGTSEADAGSDATVKAYVTGVGEISLNMR